MLCVAALVAVIFASTTSCSSRDRGSAPGASSGCASAPGRALAKLKANLEPGATVSGLVRHRAAVTFAGRVDFLAARVTTPIPGFHPTTSTVDWVWDGNSLYNLRDGDIATPRLPNFPVVGGGSDEAKAAADACLARTLSQQPQSFTIPAIDTSSKQLRISGALNATVTGTFSCIVTQASGNFHVGSSTIAIQISNVIAVSVINPPGGAKLWVFQDLPTGPDGISGVAVTPTAVRLHTSVTPLQGGKSLVLDGALPCR